jgi:arabinose-5-phosphate isomerase
VFSNFKALLMKYLNEARRVIDNEVKGILQAASKLDDSFERLIEVISNSKGRLVMCGMGKSGHIAKKMFATFVSTGTPSMYMHPAEAFHGDLGMIQKEDIFFAISNSGETSEVTQLLPFIKANGNILIAMTGNPESTLGEISDFHVDIGVEKEACPLNLAPTTSTTVSLVLGDAIAVALMKASNFQEENFAKYHPGGSLGKKLLLTVKDTLLPANFVGVNDDIISVLKSMSLSSSGVTLVGSEFDLVGIITDGDIRLALSKVDANEVFKVLASDIMSKKPKIVSASCKCGDADIQMQNEGINSLIVKEHGLVLGVYDNLNRKR